MGSFLTLAYPLFIDWNHICFFPFTRKLPFSNARFENYLWKFWNRLTTIFEQMNTYNIMTMNVFRTKVSNFFVNIIATNRYWWDNFVFFLNIKRILLELFIKEDCFANKMLKLSAFSWKLVAYLFWWLSCGMQITFYRSEASWKSANRCWAGNWINQPIW